jgi:hypothetical protein
VDGDETAADDRRVFRATTSVVHLVVAIVTTAPLAWQMGNRLSQGAAHEATVPWFNLWSLRWTAPPLAQMALAVLSALAFERLWGLRGHVARGSAALLVAVWLISSDLGAGSMTKMPPLDTAWIEWLATHPDGPIVMQGLEHGHSLVNGYSGFFPSGHRELPERLASFPDQPSLTELRDLGVTYAVADAARWSTDRDAAARRLGLEIVLSGPEGVVIEFSR